MKDGETVGDWFDNAIDNVGGFLSTVQFTDIIDIIIVGFIVYEAVRLVRETRAMQLVKGIAVFVVIYVLAIVLNLDTLSFVLNIIVNYGVIALIIMFQPELRSLLEKLGRNNFVSKLFKGETIRSAADVGRLALRQISNAVNDMSKQKIGALIVFEMQTKLGEVINTGTVINADVQQDLIKNIFYNKAPLHDGAMIIRDFRVYAAGCFLPLSQNHDISRELGTRHRAALGITEVSDALVIVVSEETGAVSCMHNGQLTRGISEQELRLVLEQYLLPEDAGMQASVKNLFGKFESSVKEPHKIAKKKKGGKNNK